MGVSIGQKARVVCEEVQVRCNGTWALAKGGGRGAGVWPVSMPAQKGMGFDDCTVTVDGCRQRRVEMAEQDHAVPPARGTER